MSGRGLPELPGRMSITSTATLPPELRAVGWSEPGCSHHAALRRCAMPMKSSSHQNHERRSMRSDHMAPHRFESREESTLFDPTTVEVIRNAYVLGCSGCDRPQCNPSTTGPTVALSIRGAEPVELDAWLGACRIPVAAIDQRPLQRTERQYRIEAIRCPTGVHVLADPARPELNTPLFLKDDRFVSKTREIPR